MTAKANPFTPIFGKVPAYMAGRQGLIQERAKGCLEFRLPGFREYLVRQQL